MGWYARARQTTERDVQLRFTGGTGAGGTSTAADPGDGRCRAEVTFTGVRSDVCHVRATVDCAGEATASVIGSGAVHGAEPAGAGGAVAIKAAVPVVRAHEHGRNGVGADSVQQESGPADGRRRRREVLRADSGSGRRRGIAFR